VVCGEEDGVVFYMSFLMDIVMQSEVSRKK
jgi:hypothetical protein